MLPGSGSDSSGFPLMVRGFRCFRRYLEFTIARSRGLYTDSSGDLRAAVMGIWEVLVRVKGLEGVTGWGLRSV